MSDTRMPTEGELIDLMAGVDQSVDALIKGFVLAACMTERARCRAWTDHCQPRFGSPELSAADAGIRSGEWPPKEEG